MKKDLIIEIPKGTNIKYEVENGKLRVDRILFGAGKYPMDYGFFENTLDWDGDPLDGLMIGDSAFIPKVIVPVRIIGAMKMIDGGETDTKLITVIDVDPRFDHIKNLNDVPKHILKEVQDFFETYKNLQGKKVVINGFEKEKYAINELAETEALYQKYKDMNKDDFISLMKKEHPNKFSK
ncbi:MAG: inorganic pyrophosphatase [Mycoplasmataceae bacterium]|nr:inorganic pyrophosphatase [Mycoplasmataceae bacterium]